MKKIGAFVGGALLAGAIASSVWAQNLFVTGQLSGGGTQTNDSACTGCIGELIAQNSSVTSSPLLVTTVPAIVTQVLLTAGDWDCRGETALVNSSGTLAATVFASWTSTSTNTSPPPIPAISAGSSINPSYVAIQAASVTSPLWALATRPMRFSLAASTSVYLLTHATFSTAGVASAVGEMSCRRIR